MSGNVATKADVGLVREDIERLKTRLELLKSQLTVRLWTAMAAFVVLMKALDHMLPTVLG